MPEELCLSAKYFYSGGLPQWRIFKVRETITERIIVGSDHSGKERGIQNMIMFFNFF